MVARDGNIDIDGVRLIDRLNRLAKLGARPNGGVTRLAWSAEMGEAVQLVGAWAEQAGATVSIDGAGNLIAEIAGTVRDLPPLVTGSHLDSVADGGYLDGAYGVVAAIEVLALWRRAGLKPRHPLRVVAFANEEGVVAPAFTGSRAIAGTLDPLELSRRGPDGLSLAERLEQAGADRSGPMAARWAAPVGAVVELHVEQGPVLDRSGYCIGVVTAITGQQRGTITFGGAANHAGTTPMSARSDALVAAAHAILTIRGLAAKGIAEVATAGRIEVSPNVANVIPGYCQVSVDIRAGDPIRIEAAVQALTSALEAIASTTATTVTIDLQSRSVPVPTDPGLRRLISRAASARGFDAVEVVSGAGHDCANLTGLGPVAMIFVPSIGGVSHHHSERTDLDHLVAGAAVLLDTLRAADRDDAGDYAPGARHITHPGSRRT